MLANVLLSFPKLFLMMPFLSYTHKKSFYILINEFFRGCKLAYKVLYRIKFYNLTKGGVDDFNKLNRDKTTKRSNNRCHMTYFFGILDISIFKKKKSQWCTIWSANNLHYLIITWWMSELNVYKIVINYVNNSI